MMSDFPDIPEKFSALLDLHAPDLDVKRSQAESSKSRQFQGPPVPASVPEYLSVKLASLHERVDYLNNLQRALRDLERSERTSIAESRETGDRVERAKLSLRGEALEIKRFESRIAEDMTDYLACSPFPDLGKAYAAAMLQFVNSASANQEKTSINRANFKTAVLELYKASRTVNGTKQTFCQVLGWHDASLVSAAHLVPKSLDKYSCEPLFGSELDPPKDPRNALSISRGLEKALDSGKLVFVPVTGQTNAWKCVVTNKDQLDCEIMPRWTWKEIDGRHLRFNSPVRPRKRYLFFRYLITYLRQKRNRNLKWAEDIEAEFEAWVTPGSYLRQSPLRNLLQQATGQELPETMFRMFGSTADDGLDDLSDKEKRDRKDHISHLVDSAILNTRPTDPDEEKSDEE